MEVRMCTKPTREQYFPTLFWARPHELAGDSSSESAAALAYLSDFSTGLPRQHGQSTLGPSLDHSLWLHRPFVWPDPPQNSLRLPASAPVATGADAGNWREFCDQRWVT
jgi:acyl-CoA thioesterase